MIINLIYWRENVINLLDYLCDTNEPKYFYFPKCFIVYFMSCEKTLKINWILIIFIKIVQKILGNDYYTTFSCNFGSRENIYFK